MGNKANRRRILITGGDGQLGWELARVFAGQGEVVALDRRALDLADPGAIRRCCREVAPTLILNAGAYTAVDRAESESDAAMQINRDAPATFAEEANRLGALLVHYSTDYVFDGTSARPYREDDPTVPQSVYGRSKLAGEQAVATVARQHLIFRTSWLYGNRRQNFYLTMLRLAGERDELRVVADQVGSPTWVHHVAEVTRLALADGEATIDAGIYHLSAGGATSWHGFASAILDAVPDTNRRASRIVPIATIDYPTPARRPAYSVLCNARIEAALGIRVPGWRAQLAACVAERTTLTS
jgi:dTDP-4-dehydrorhamnose reductase